jgi:hypothetical protein
MLETLVHGVKFLPFKLPSRKDTTVVLLRRSAPYVGFGLTALAIASCVMSGARFYEPWLWALRSLGNRAQFLALMLLALLTLVCLGFASYAIGVLLVETLRRTYRICVVTLIENRLEARRSKRRSNRGH